MDKSEKKNYQGKVQFIFTDDITGKEKKVTELYLIEAVTVGDAEAKLYKEFEGESNFTIQGVTETKIIKLIK